MLFNLVAGPLIVFYGIHIDHRDRPSLLWPKVSGKMTQCDEIYHRGGSGTYGIEATYTYFVNNQNYVEHQIALWNPDLSGRTGNFKSTHPVSSPVDVYYDPQNPANAVLIPGADEALNRLVIIVGSLVLGIGIALAFMLRPAYVKYKAEEQPTR